MTSRGTSYRPELDGIRAVAVMAVVGFHSFVQVAQGGWLGVDIFFVLSGYLITGILLSEHSRTGAVRLGNFLVRRLLRLYPALLVTLVLGAFFYGTLGGDGGTVSETGDVTILTDASFLDYLGTIAPIATYVENFYLAFGHNAVDLLGHTWSLAVEMQFYLVWPPLLVWLLARRKNLLTWVLVGIAVSYLLMVLQSGPEHLALPNAYYLPWTRAWELLAGALVAVLAARPQTRPARLIGSRWAGWSIVAGLGLVILVASTYSILLIDYVLLWEAPIAVALTALLIAHLNEVGATGPGAVLAWKPLVWIGKLSYGIYLVHYPTLWILRDHGLPDDHGTLVFALAMAISTAVAAASYYLVEQPVLKVKRRYEPAPT
ncbi:MAG: acyltransferase [Microbacterium sp.]|nr:MAG: acyltransferase [Microbacterium sp.]